MFSSLRIGSLIVSGVTISSVLLFPESKVVNNYPNVKSLNNLEKSLDELKNSELSALSVWRHFQAMLMEEFSTINYDSVSEEEMKILLIKSKIWPCRLLNR